MFSQHRPTLIITESKIQIKQYKPFHRFVVLMSLGNFRASLVHSRMSHEIWKSFRLVSSIGHTQFLAIYPIRSPNSETNKKQTFYFNYSKSINIMAMSNRKLTTIGKQSEIFSYKFFFRPSSEKMLIFFVPWLAVHNRHNS